MISIKIENTEEQLIFDADSFEVTKCHEFVYLYKGNKKVALLRMDRVRAVMKINSLSDIK